MIELILVALSVLFGPEIIKFLAPEKPIKQSEPDPEITDPCEHIIYKPLSPEFSQGSSLLPKGYCYKGDMTYWDNKPHTQGDPYADKQAEKFIATQKKDAEVASMKSIVLILANTTAAEIDTTVTDAADETVVFPPPTPPAVPVATAATGVDDGAFTANWGASAGTSEYFLDVATDSGFLAMVTGYDNKSVGNVVTLVITGLTNNTFYYRVRAKGNGLTSASSNTITLSTVLMDIDGNSYSQVTIGNQIWLQQNLKTTKYADGSAIPNLTITDYNDYYLPSKDELNQMYVNLHLFGVGGFANQEYWASSEFNATNAWEQNFGSGVQYSGFGKNGVYYVRACRSFTAAVGAYALRSTGPAGGLVFYTDGAGNYLEAAPSDQSTGAAWSTGQANTTAMLAQSATAPSAKLCNDLSIGGWINDTTGAYCWYNNDIANKGVYGALYNWPVVNYGSQLAYLTRNGSQVAGWRIPTIVDRNDLDAELGGNTVSGGKMKEAGLAHWTTPNTSADNSSGFTGLPSGGRHLLGSFVNKGNNNYFWTSTPGIPGNHVYYGMSYNSATLAGGGSDDNNGWALRLVKDV
jgi:uncharacterized protein (TIGR02145 family)